MALPAPYCQKEYTDPKLRAHGCGIAALQWLGDAATAGDLHMTRQMVIDRDAAAQLRRTGVTDAEFMRRGTTLDEVETGYEHAGNARKYKDLGRVAPRMRKFHGGNLEDDLRPALQAGSVAVVAVNYGVIVDSPVPSGSTFRGGHWVCVAKNPSAGKVTVSNSLLRRLTIWPWSLLVEAAEKFGDRPWLGGRGEFGVVAPSQTFLEQCKQRNANLRKRLTAALDELEKCRGSQDCADSIALEHARTIDQGIAALEALR